MRAIASPEDAFSLPAWSRSGRHRLSQHAEQPRHRLRVRDSEMHPGSSPTTDSTTWIGLEADKSVGEVGPRGQASQPAPALTADCGPAASSVLKPQLRRLQKAPCCLVIEASARVSAPLILRYAPFDTFATFTVDYGENLGQRWISPKDTPWKLTDGSGMYRLHFFIQADK